MNAYPAYKDSGIAWIGDIPAHWEVRRLKHCLSKILGGGTPSTENPEFWHGEIPWLSAKDIKVSKWIFSGEDFITALALENSATNLAEPGAIIVVTRSGILKHTFPIAMAGAYVAINQDLRALTPKEEVDSEFLFWSLGGNQKSVLEECVKQGTTVESVEMMLFMQFPIPLPPPAEQKAIAAYLDQKTTQLDRLLEAKRQQIALLKEERTALVNTVVTKGLDPNAPMKDSGIPWIGEIPAHWEVKKLKWVTNILRGKFSHRPRNDERLYGGDYPFLQTGDVSQAKKHIIGYSQTLNEFGKSVSSEFPRGTLVMTIAATVAEVAILDFDACFPDSIIGFLPNENCDNEFLYYYLRSSKQKFLSESIMNTQLNLNIERVGEVEICLPPIKEQFSLSKHILRCESAIETTISTAEQEIQLLQEYRKALISEVVTGKVMVPEINPATLQHKMEVQP